MSRFGREGKSCAHYVVLESDKCSSWKFTHIFVVKPSRRDELQIIIELLKLPELRLQRTETPPLGFPPTKIRLCRKSSNADVPSSLCLLKLRNNSGQFFFSFNSRERTENYFSSSFVFLWKLKIFEDHFSCRLGLFLLSGLYFSVCGFIVHFDVSLVCMFIMRRLLFEKVGFCTWHFVWK